MSKKKQILALLEKDRGRYISGADFAARLNVSRNAVWKAIGELRKDGYKIEAVTNKGYCLCEGNDILSVQGMIPYLPQECVPEKIYIYESLESTNTTAKEMALSGAEHGTVVIADGQTAGQGRYGRSFHSPPGRGLYMSFVLRPARLCFSTPTLITAFAAVSVCEAIEAVSEKKPLIKWVNDIFIDGKKICGISTEAVTDLESGCVRWVVLGIGVNLTTPAEGYPEGLRDIIGSVFGFDKPAVTRNRLASEIISRIARPGTCEKGVLEKYKRRMFMLGKTVLVVGAGEAYEAAAVDIDGAGRLMVKRDDGEIRSLNFGEISIVNPKEKKG
jgi:BirA family biotin operon repressor/biotin-[acetyl-CoA-carboxylase] ligase